MSEFPEVTCSDGRLSFHIWYMPKAGLYVHSFGFLQVVLHWNILEASVRPWEVVLSLPSTYPSPFNKPTIHHRPYCLYIWHLLLDRTGLTLHTRAVRWAIVIGFAMHGSRLDVQPDSTAIQRLWGFLQRLTSPWQAIPTSVGSWQVHRRLTKAGDLYLSGTAPV